MRIAVITASLFLLSACSLTPPPPYEIQTALPARVSEDSPRVSVVYQDHDNLMLNAQTSVAGAFKSKGEFQQYVEALPSGGRVQIIVDHPNAELANMKHYGFVVFDQFGKELLRGYGLDAAPQVKRDSFGWRSYALVDLVDPIDESVVVQVVNRRTQQAWNFKIKRNEQPES